MAEQIKVPDIGEYSNVDVVEVMVKVGDQIQEEDSLVSLETDKATMEIPAPKAGTVKSIKLKEGDKVSEGDLILELETEASDDHTDQQTSEPAETEEKSKSEKAESAQAPQGSDQSITVPDIGEYDSVDVIEVFIKAGDVLEEEAPLIALETDKATMEIPMPFAGTITKVMVKEGDKVSTGDQIAVATSNAGGGDAKAESKTESTPSKAESTTETPQKESAPAEKKGPEIPTHSGPAHASPAIRRLARELGADLAKVSATGRKGRVTEEDLKKHVKNIVQSAGQGGGAGLGLLPDPVVDFAKFGEIEAKPLPRIKKISGANLSRNWIKIPHITFFEDADITDLEAFRKAKKTEAEKLGIKVTPVAFLVKAAAKALSEFPNVNSSLSPDGEQQIFKQYVHVGVAVDTPHGLMVPVIRDADKKSIYEIAADLIDLSTRARAGKLAPSEMQGGCFSISSLGNIGTKGFAPIVNMPEVAILGVAKASIQPVYDGNTFVPRLMLPLSLSADHRVIDGAEAGKFLVTISKYLADIRELVL